MNMKNLKYIVKAGTLVFAVLMILNTSCTKLKNTNYNALIASDFSPASSDLQALAGAAYVNWRDVLLQ